MPLFRPLLSGLASSSKIRPVYLTDDDDHDKRRKRDPVDLFDIKSTSTRHLDRGRSKWIGTEFSEFNEWKNEDYEEFLPDQLMKVEWVKPYSGIHWLN